MPLEHAGPDGAPGAYRHWGLSQPSGGANKCAVAAAGLAYGLGNAWGWADAGCEGQAVYMCRVPGGWPGWAARGRGAWRASPAVVVGLLTGLGCAAAFGKLFQSYDVHSAFSWGLHKTTAIRE